MEQTQKRFGRRIIILGIWQPAKQFDYALAQGGFKTESYLKVMNWQAQKAAERLAQSGQMVIVQDQGSVHTSHVAQAQLNLFPFPTSGKGLQYED